MTNVQILYLILFVTNLLLMGLVWVLVAKAEQPIFTETTNPKKKRLDIKREFLRKMESE